ncbi:MULTISPECIES: hypothetical protein [unclassified Streptomyces]|uniref:hypothetical protein n=1 Tax=unclassified Streptomyces TaxID=2593676 RepID=UPI00332BE64E
MTPRATTGRRGQDAPAAAGRGEPADAPLGGTRSLLEAVLRELNQGLHSHRPGQQPIPRPGPSDNSSETSGS